MTCDFPPRCDSTSMDRTTLASQVVVGRPAPAAPGHHPGCKCPNSHRSPSGSARTSQRRTCPSLGSTALADPGGVLRQFFPDSVGSGHPLIGRLSAWRPERGRPVRGRSSTGRQRRHGLALPAPQHPGAHGGVVWRGDRGGPFAVNAVSGDVLAGRRGLPPRGGRPRLRGGRPRLRGVGQQ
jgi:hypothetical protein